MNLRTLLQKLIEIEQSVGVDTNNVIRMKMQDVEDDVLQMQKETALRLRNEHSPHAVF